MDKGDIIVLDQAKEEPLLGWLGGLLKIRGRGPLAASSATWSRI